MKRNKAWKLYRSIGNLEDKLIYRLKKMKPNKKLKNQGPNAGKNLETRWKQNTKQTKPLYEWVLKNGSHYYLE